MFQTFMNHTNIWNDNLENLNKSFQQKRATISGKPSMRIALILTMSLLRHWWSVRWPLEVLLLAWCCTLTSGVTIICLTRVWQPLFPFFVTKRSSLPSVYMYASETDWVVHLEGNKGCLMYCAPTLRCSYTRDLMAMSYCDRSYVPNHSQGYIRSYIPILLHC